MSKSYRTPNVNLIRYVVVIALLLLCIVIGLNYIGNLFKKEMLNNPNLIVVIPRLQVILPIPVPRLAMMRSVCRLSGVSTELKYCRQHPLCNSL